jgi:hypothetical protein
MLAMGQQTQQHRPHMSPAQCADYLGCSVDWLNASRCRGDGPPFYKLGRLVKYIPDVVDDWARNRLVKSTSEAVQ